jgi:hypothetical protein
MKSAALSGTFGLLVVTDFQGRVTKTNINMDLVVDSGDRF